MHSVSPFACAKWAICARQTRGSRSGARVGQGRAGTWGECRLCTKIVLEVWYDARLRIRFLFTDAVGRLTMHRQGNNSSSSNGSSEGLMISSLHCVLVGTAVLPATPRSRSRSAESRTPRLSGSYVGHRLVTFTNVKPANSGGASTKAP